MLKRKYITEYALGYKNNYWSVMTVNQLMQGWKLVDGNQPELDKCHIYIIASRPSPYFVDGSVKYEVGKLSGEIGYRIDGKEHRLPFSGYEFELSDGAVEVKIAPYPHRDIWSYDKDGQEVRYAPATLLASLYGAKGGVAHMNQFEVLYVGQAIGKGNRSAQERLMSHSTLQKILARTQHDYPDKEINIFMLQFEHSQVFSSMDGRAVDAIDTDENEERLMNAIRNPPDKKQKIAMVEAGLIRYFQPPYNKIFTIKFPSTKLKTLKSCLDLDVSGLVVELDTMDFNFFLYSKTVRPALTHFAKYDFFSPKNRASFFNATGFTEMPGIVKASN